jgi:hypothetical protein
MMRSRYLALAGAVLIGLTMAAFRAGPASAQEEVVVIDGTHWQELDEAQRVAFVSGITHLVEFERQLNGNAFDPDGKSFIPHLVKAMQGKTTGDVSVAVTKYYVAHPDDLGRPVISTILRVYSVKSQ